MVGLCCVIILLGLMSGTYLVRQMDKAERVFVYFDSPNWISMLIVAIIGSFCLFKSGIFRLFRKKRKWSWHLISQCAILTLSGSLSMIDSFYIPFLIDFRRRGNDERTMNKLTQYLTDSLTELKKVQWPSREQTVKHTLWVIIFSLVAGIILAAFDYLFVYLLGLIIIK